MLQKVSDSRSNSKDLKDFVIKFDEIESLKNDLNKKSATIQNITKKNVELKAALDAKKKEILKKKIITLEEKIKKLKQVNDSLNVENKSYKTFQNSSEITIQNITAQNVVLNDKNKQYEQEIENLKSLLNNSIGHTATEQESNLLGCF